MDGILARFDLGFTPSFGPPDFAFRLGTVTKGGAAEVAELKPGDAIVKAAGREVKGFIDLKEALAPLAPGGSVKLEIRRGDESLEVELELVSPQTEE
jgi:S1-C subfamily serine protease